MCRYLVIEIYWNGVWTWVFVEYEWVVGREGELLHRRSRAEETKDRWGEDNVIWADSNSLNYMHWYSAVKAFQQE